MKQVNHTVVVVVGSFIVFITQHAANASLSVKLQLRQHLATSLLFYISSVVFIQIEK